MTALAYATCAADFLDAIPTTTPADTLDVGAIRAAVDNLGHRVLIEDYGEDSFALMFTSDIIVSDYGPVGRAITVDADSGVRDWTTFTWLKGPSEPE